MCPVAAFSRFVVGRRGDLLRRVFFNCGGEGIRFCFFPIVAECRENNLNGGIASAFSFDCLLSCGDGLERRVEYDAC